MDDNLAHCSYEVGHQYPFHTNVADKCRPACSRTPTSPLLRTCGKSYRDLRVGKLEFLITMYRTRTVSPLSAPDAPLDISIHFDKGLPVKVVTPQKTVTDSLELFELLNALGKEHGVGRIVSIR